MEDKQTLDIDSIHLDDPVECCDSAPVSPSRDKRRKKKKKSKNHNPANIHAFNEDRQQKLVEEKTRQLEKSATFPRSDPCPIPLQTSKAFEYEDAHSLDDGSPWSPLSSSCPLFSLRSALRGGHEGLGLGPRPKLHVRWAVDVHDPPKSSVSHTINRHSSKKKRSKSKTKAKLGALKLQNNSSIMETQEVVPDSPVSENETVDDKPVPTTTVGTPLNFSLSMDKLHDNSRWASPKSFLAFMEVAMQHMFLASSFIEKENVVGGLIEYKAAENVFRLAKLDAEMESHKDCRTAAIRGQVLAWIAMATLYSATGQSSKAQKCHNLALTACQDVGISLAESIESVTKMENFSGHKFKENGGSNNCSVAAALLSTSACGASRTEII